MEFYNTYNSQFEILPRFTIIYGTKFNSKGFALEWLWFGVYFKFKNNHKH